MDELDVPGLRSYIRLPLTKVGTTARLIPFKLRERPAEPAETHLCSIQLYTNLPAERRGIHLSRFSEILQSASDEEFASLQHLACWVAEKIKVRQQVDSSTVIVQMPWVRDDLAPISGLKTKKAYQVASEATMLEGKVTARLGVVVPIILACPCVQVNLESKLSTLAPELGILPADYEKIKKLFPMASHTQRGRTEVWLGDEEKALRPLELIHTIEGVVSVTHDLLKRPDEVEVVESAHRHPQFCEDVTRAIASALYRQFAGKLPRETNISIRVTSEESIHSYDLISELEAPLGALEPV